VRWPDFPHVVYRIYDQDDRLLYVGMSSNPKARLTAHRNYSPWMIDAVRHEEVTYPSHESAREAEMGAIRDEDPLHNIEWSRINSRRRPPNPLNAARLTEAREQKGWTYKDLHRASGVTVESIKAIERGSDPRAITVVKLARALDLDVSELLPEPTV